MRRSRNSACRPLPIRSDRPDFVENRLHKISGVFEARDLGLALSGPHLQPKASIFEIPRSVSRATAMARSLSCSGINWGRAFPIHSIGTGEKAPPLLGAVFYSSVFSPKRSKKARQGIPWLAFLLIGPVFFGGVPGNLTGFLDGLFTNIGVYREHCRIDCELFVKSGEIILAINAHDGLAHKSVQKKEIRRHNGAETKSLSPAGIPQSGNNSLAFPVLKPRSSCGLALGSRPLSEI